MSHYNHLSISEREKILVLCTKEKKLREIAREIGRSVATISRELTRNSDSKQGYSAVDAETKYQNRRKNCKRHKLLSNVELHSVVRRLFLEEQRSPEQIVNRVIQEKSRLHISYATVYRAIYAGIFDTVEQRRSKGYRGAIRKLRRRRKTRRRKGTVETRRKIVIRNRIQERPQEAEDRPVIGLWEADTVVGKTGSAHLVTITDRGSRYLLAGRVARKSSALVCDETIALLSALPKEKCRTITPDRSKEFSNHGSVTQALNGLPFYFPDSHAPWRRGTNENTNGLLREYLPKSFDIALPSDQELTGFLQKLNSRLCKGLA